MEALMSDYKRATPILYADRIVAFEPDISHQGSRDMSLGSEADAPPGSRQRREVGALV